MNLKNLKIRTRFLLFSGFLSIGIAFFGGWSLKTLKEVQVNGPLYDRIVQSKDLIADILPPPEYIIEAYLTTMQLTEATQKAQQDEYVERLKFLKKNYDSRHDYWIKADLGPKFEDLFLKQAHEPALAFFKLTFDQLVPAVQRGDLDSAKVVMTELGSAYNIHRSAIDKVVGLAITRTESSQAAAIDRIDSSTTLLSKVLIVTLAGAVGGVY